MGTNFYLMTKNKSIAEKIGDFELADKPDWGYEIHIGKRSGGWLPIFQSHPGIKSVKDYEHYCTMPDVRIYNEYYEEFTWEQLKEELIYWNGGVDGAIPKEYHEQDPNDMFYDPMFDGYTPISHFTYNHGRYAHYYTRDPEGFEFTKGNFS